MLIACDAISGEATAEDDMGGSEPTVLLVDDELGVVSDGRRLTMLGFMRIESAVEVATSNGGSEILCWRL